jgi:UDP-N-acetylmuramoyl-tripeptide--D-alanyl-D-alanine ligase
VRFRTSDVPGTLVGPDVEFEGAAIDSRLLRPGQLFVPVVAERDGHDFIHDAVAAGAVAYLTSRRPAPVSASAVVVTDTTAALADVARAARSRIPDRVVGITGSTGKTSTKDLLGAVVSGEGPCAVSERNFNNELGVPLTLVNGPDGPWGAVVEMGARGGPRDIAWLCEVARPTVGVVTNVSLSHTQFLGTVENVAAVKGDLVASLPPQGTAVLNVQDQRVAAMAARTQASVLTFSVDGGGDVRATKVRLDDELRPSFTLETPWGATDVELEARGAHQAANAAAAAAAALCLGIDLADVATRLATARLSPWRMEVLRAPSGAVVLNDAYNANPASTEAALHALAAVPLGDGGRRLAVLGPMLELGEASVSEHRRVVAVARELGIGVVAVGTADYGIEPAADVGPVVAELGEGDALLVKGSRAAGLERVVQAVMESAVRAAEGGRAPW